MLESHGRRHWDPVTNGSDVYGVPVYSTGVAFTEPFYKRLGESLVKQDEAKQKENNNNENKIRPDDAFKKYLNGNISLNVALHFPFCSSLASFSPFPFSQDIPGRDLLWRGSKTTKNGLSVSQSQ